MRWLYKKWYFNVVKMLIRIKWNMTILVNALFKKNNI